MPRRKRAFDVTLDAADGGGGGGDENGSGDDIQVDGSEWTGGDSADALLARAREFIQLNRELNEVNTQVKALRKSLKSVEQSLLAGMLNTKTEQIECDGVTIVRTKKLQLNAE